MTVTTVDFDNLTDEQRLVLVECILGLLPSGPDWQGRVVYLAFQIAQGERGYPREALNQLGLLAPEFFDKAVYFAQKNRGLDI